MLFEIPHGDKSGKPWIVQEPEIDKNLLSTADIEPDGGDQFAAMTLGGFDAKNARAVGRAQAQRQAAEARLPLLKRNAKRAAKHLSHTHRTRTVVVRRKVAELPQFHNIEAIISIVFAATAIAANNEVLSSYVVSSGHDLYANDRIGAHLFAGLAILVALGIRTSEHWLPSDKARDRYATIFFAIGVSTFLLWATATASTFAPSTSSIAWLAPGADNGWAGIVLILAHVLGDSAWGYLLIAGAEKILLGNYQRIEIDNPHYAVAEEQADRANAALTTCLREVADADAFIAAVAHTRTELQARIELELDRRTALWRAQREAGVALARAHFLNTKGSHHA